MIKIRTIDEHKADGLRVLQCLHQYEDVLPDIAGRNYWRDIDANQIAMALLEAYTSGMKDAIAALGLLEPSAVEAIRNEEGNKVG